MKKSVRRRAAALLMACLMVLTVCVPAWAGQVGISISASVEGDSAGEINQFLEGSYIDLVAGDVQDGGLLNIYAGLAGMDIFKLFLEFTPQTLAFSLPDADPNRYEYPTEKLLELVRTNVTGSLSLPDGQSLQISELPAAGPDIAPEEYQEVLMPYLQYLGGAVGEKLQVSANADIELPRIGTSVTGMLYVYEPAPEDLSKIFADLADMIESDEDLAVIVRKWVDFVRSLQDVAAISEVAAQTDSGMTADEMADKLAEFFENLPATLREGSEVIAQGYGENDGYIRLSVGMTNTVNLISLEVGENTGILVSGGCELLHVGDHRQAAFGFTSEGEEYALVFDGTRSEDSSEGTVTLRVSGYEMARLTYSWDNTDRSELKVPYGSCQLTAAGIINASLTVGPASQGGSDHILTISGLENVTGSPDLTGATVTVHSTGDITPQAPAGTSVDLSTYTEEQLLQLAQELAGKVLAPFGMAQ